jgi:hypothetical protein
MRRLDRSVLPQEQAADDGFSTFVTAEMQ